MGDGLGGTADFLDGRYAPPPRWRRRAGRRFGTTRGRRRRFAEVVRAATLDLKPVRELHDGLARFDEGLGTLHATLDPRRLAGLRRATGGRGRGLGGARPARRAAGYTYPVVTMTG